ncbi:Serine/arginine-rich splicing factor RSZ22A [Morella rubra]|uniref:Serine/arginine-rich splicing factor RSZ22A n=1 Tax=Morella rubra TaxID=262757 RepID=A0A6A1UWI6_9ROSI|nr:Serine/arginine-rich splicing factor RSZ22A [Morella rubra]
MTRIYVGNLDPRVTERDLEDEFRVFGVIESVWVARRPPGYAFIDFEDRRDAEDAIRELDEVDSFCGTLKMLEVIILSNLRSYSPRGGGGGGGGRSPRRRSLTPPRGRSYSRSPAYRGREEVPYANGSPAVLCFGDIVLSMWCGLVSGVARRSRAPPIGEDLWQLALELKQLPELAFSAKAASLVGLIFAG